jgi:AsmA family protein
VDFTLPHGVVAGKLRLDARTDPAHESVDVKITNVRMEDFSHAKTSPIEGLFEARAVLTTQGDSVHRAASNANGRVTMVAPSGEVRQTIAELLGIDVVRGLGLLLAKDQSETPIRCAVADFQARNGVLTANKLVMDTDLTLAQGGGEIDLRNEAVNIRLTGDPKHFQLIRVRAPITVTGSLARPRVGLAPGKAPLQGAAAVVLGVVFPPAAILPFVDLGLAKNADCAGIIAQAKQAGAPVKPISPRASRRHTR